MTGELLNEASFVRDPKYERDVISERVVCPWADERIAHQNTKIAAV